MIERNNPNSPTFLYDDFPLHWQMTRWEKIFLATFVEKYRFSMAIEVGTYLGGSLQVLSKYCQKVISIDISENPKKQLAAHFKNVEFLVGDSKTLLPETLVSLSKKQEQPNLILIDGDHSRNGVHQDIQNALTYYAQEQELFIICHDSFNPQCRQGMLDVDYEAFPNVHFVEIDFIPGVYHYEAFDTAEARSMWGGLALLHVKPQKRENPLVVRESQKSLFESTYHSSQIDKRIQS